MSRANSEHLVQDSSVRWTKFTSDRTYFHDVEGSDDLAELYKRFKRENHSHIQFEQRDPLTEMTNRLLDAWPKKWPKPTVIIDGSRNVDIVYPDDREEFGCVARILLQRHESIEPSLFYFDEERQCEIKGFGGCDDPVRIYDALETHINNSVRLHFPNLDVDLQPLAYLSDGWDGPDSYAPTPEVIRLAGRMLMQYPKEWKPPTVDCDCDGTIVMEVMNDKGYICYSISVIPDIVDGIKSAYIVWVVMDIDLPSTAPKTGTVCTEDGHNITGVYDEMKTLVSKDV